MRALTLQPWRGVVLVGLLHAGCGPDLLLPAPGVERQALIVPAGNRTANPSFETDLSNWSAYNGTFERVASAAAPHGDWVARATWSMGNYYTVDDGPSAVNPATVGAIYYASACVAAASPSAIGKGATVNLRARDNTFTQIGLQESPYVLLDSAFQLVTTSYVAPANTAEIDIYVVQLDADAGDVFDIDAVLLTEQPLPPLSCARQDGGETRDAGTNTRPALHYPVGCGCDGAAAGPLFAACLALLASRRRRL